MQSRRNVLLMLLLFFLPAPAVAQNGVLATSQGYQLTENDLRPALELLVFMAGSGLSEQEVQYIVGEAVQEFQATPVALLESMQQLSQAINQAQATSDPMLLGRVRQELIGEFYKMALSTPQDQMPAYLAVLFRKAPVVAYDPRTGVALTQPDLEASVEFLKALNTYRGNEIPPSQMALAGAELKNGFASLDEESQKLLASGTILHTILEKNLQQMSPQQQTQVTNHFRTTVGGPPSRTRSGAGQALSRDGVQNAQGMMESLRATGGTDDYWKAAQQF